MDSTAITTSPANGLPIALPQRGAVSLDVDRLAVQISILRARQLRRPDVREKLAQIAERREAWRL